MSDAKTEFNALFDTFLSSEFFGTAAKSVSISVESGGTIDPITGATTGETTTVYTAYGFIRNPRKQEFVNAMGGDLVFTCKQDDLAYTPIVNDTVTLSSGSTFDGVYQVQELMADGADVTYRMLLRR